MRTYNLSDEIKPRWGAVTSHITEFAIQLSSVSQFCLMGHRIFPILNSIFDFHPLVFSFQFSSSCIFIELYFHPLVFSFRFLLSRRGPKVGGSVVESCERAPIALCIPVTVMARRAKTL